MVTYRGLLTYRLNEAIQSLIKLVLSSSTSNTLKQGRPSSKTIKNSQYYFLINCDPISTKNKLHKFYYNWPDTQNEIRQTCDIHTSHHKKDTLLSYNLFSIIKASQSMTQHIQLVYKRITEDHKNYLFILLSSTQLDIKRKSIWCILLETRPIQVWNYIKNVCGNKKFVYTRNKRKSVIQSIGYDVNYRYHRVFPFFFFYHFDMKKYLLLKVY